MVFDEFAPIELGKTPNGKTGVARLANSGYYNFGFAEGGELPSELQGAYSSPEKMKNIFARYVQKLCDKHVENKKQEEAKAEEAEAKKPKVRKTFKAFMKEEKLKPKEEPKLEINRNTFKKNKLNPMAAFANMEGVVMLGEERPPEVITCTVKER